MQDRQDSIYRRQPAAMLLQVAGDLKIRLFFEVTVKSERLYCTQSSRPSD